VGSECALVSGKWYYHAFCADDTALRYTSAFRNRGVQHFKIRYWHDFIVLRRVVVDTVSFSAASLVMARQPQSAKTSSFLRFQGHTQSHRTR